MHAYSAKLLTFQTEPVVFPDRARCEFMMPRSMLAIRQCHQITVLSSVIYAKTGNPGLVYNYTAGVSFADLSEDADLLLSLHL